MVTAARPAGQRTGRKRGNNEGSIRQRPVGLHEARVSLPDGKRKSFYGKTRAEVARKMTEARRALDQGLTVSTNRQTLGQFMDSWLRDVARPRVRAKTLQRYELDVRRITAKLGRLRLSEVSPQHIQAFLNELAGSGYAPATVKHARAVLRSALGQAESWGRIVRNPAEGKRVTTPRGERPEVAALSEEQARAILMVFRGHSLEGLVYLALATGLRQGELLGTRWEDMDLETGTLTVRYQLQRIRGQHVITEPKSKKSRRHLALPPDAVDALRVHRVRQIEARLAAGDAWRPTIGDLVFTASVGTPFDASNISRRFQAQLARAGLPKMRFHDLRHGVASLLIAQGADLRRVMEQLGHSQISLTANTYTHLTAAVMRYNAAKLHLALAGGALG